jgi:peptidoglycan/LPS O-acetylase OafA/YrhL
VGYSWLDWKPDIPAHWASLFFSERNLDMLFGYGAGVLLRADRIPLRWGRVSFWVGLAGLVGGTALLNINQGDLTRSLFLGLPVALFILGLAALEKAKTNDWPVRVLTWRGLVWLGGASYVLYLSHGIFLQAWARLFPITPGLTPLITLAGVGVAAVGSAFWEEPVLRKLRSWLKLD